MSLWEATWRVGAPLFVVVCAAAAVLVAVSDPPDRFSRPRGWQWAWVGLWLMATGGAGVSGPRRALHGLRVTPPYGGR